MDKINTPKALNTPEQLKFLRNTLCDIINEFDITNACIRITEASSKNINIQRVYIEGVIQELFASSTILKYYIGQISNISSYLGIERTMFKPYAEGKEVFSDFKDWKDYCLEERESLMSAISALNIR